MPKLSPENKKQNLDIRDHTVKLMVQLNEDARNLYGLSAASLFRRVKQGEFRNNRATRDMAAGFEFLVANSLPAGTAEGLHKAQIQPELLREVILY